MGQLIRFGRRVPLPSTVQIVHDLLVAQQNDNAQQLEAANDVASTIGPETRPPIAEMRVPPQGK